MTSDPPRPLTVTVANPRWLDDDEDGPHVNRSSTPDFRGEQHAIGGHRRPRRGTSMLCDRHQRLRLLLSCRLCETCGKATDRCGWTLRTPPIWLHSPQCAECNHVGGRSGRWLWRAVALPQSHAIRLREVASEECLTGITELGVQRALWSSLCCNHLI